LNKKTTQKVNFANTTLKITAMKKLVILLVILISVSAVQAQETAKKSKKELKAEKKAQQMAEVKAIVESKNFVFDARTANPMKGRTVNLTTDYNMKIRNDSVYSYLPYYGVAHNASSFGGSDSPMNFNSTVEEYSSELTKSGYMVKFKTRNGSDLLSCTLHVSETGSSTLSVSSMNRQSISYFGDLRKEK
jgi:hypothetical protein